VSWTKATGICMIYMLHAEVAPVVTTCSDVTEYQAFTGPWCFHLQGEVHINSLIWIKLLKWVSLQALLTTWYHLSISYAQFTVNCIYLFSTQKSWVNEMLLLNVPQGCTCLFFLLKLNLWEQIFNLFIFAFSELLQYKPGCIYTCSS